jgi:hypothetical protein
MDTPPQDARAAFPPSTGLALASLLLGIAALGLSFILLGFFIGAVGAALGMAYLVKKRGPTTMAMWGVGLSLLGIFASIGFAVLYFHYYHLMSSSFRGATVAPSGALANSSPLPANSSLLKSNLVWSTTIPGARALCAGDWESDGSARVLVAAGQTLHVLDLTGAEKSTLPLPDQFTAIECGRNKAGAHLLGYKLWGNQVSVIDHSGKLVWSESASMGLDGAHWGDLKGDGNDEMIVGMNGFGGLEALSSDGKKLWSANLANVWSQAIVPAAPHRPALVLATDASGSVNLFDAAGHRQNVLRPEGGYYTGMTAAVAESNSVQILAFSGNASSVAAFDLTGKVAWITSVLSSAPSSGNGKASAIIGDFLGNGAKEWAFMDGSGDLVIATTGGQKVASIPAQSSFQGLAVAPRPGQSALLLTLGGGVVRAYSFGH